MNVLKQVFLNVAILVPQVRRLASRRHRTGMNNDDSEVNYTYDRLLRYVDPADKNILELGPGQTPRLLERALANGARTVTGLDVGPKPPGWPEYVHHQTYLGQELPFDNSSFDVVWSNSCLEHVRYPRLTVEEVHRVLRPSGIFISSIDLRDHFYLDKRLHAEHLSYSGWLWNAMTWNRSVFTNRLRWNDWQGLLQDTGFDLSVFEPEACEVLRGIYASHPASKLYSIEEFSTVGLFFVAVSEKNHHEY